MARGTIGERTASILCLWRTPPTINRGVRLGTESSAGGDDSHALHNVVDEEDDGRTLGGGVFVHQPARPVFANDELRAILDAIRAVQRISRRKPSVATHLQRLVEPTVAAVPASSASVQHLCSHAARVHLIGHAGHRRVQTHGEDALLDGADRLLVCFI